MSDLYQRELNALIYLRDIGLLKFKARGSIIKVSGYIELWSSGGGFRQRVIFARIDQLTRKIQYIYDIEEIV